MLTNIDIDEAIVSLAMRLSGARSKREVVDRALRDMVARAQRPSIQQLYGIGGVAEGYDPKQPGVTGDAAGRYRVEEPKAAYRTSKRKAKPAAAKRSR
jgi:hypothetical protein